MGGVRWRAVVGAVLLATACGDAGADADASPLVVTDIAADVGIDDATTTHGENCVADLDDDGDRDLVLSVHDGGWWIVHATQSGRFVMAHRFADRDRHGCAVADFDGDGRLDIYMSIGGCRGTCRSPNELWLQQPDGSFVDAAAAWGVEDADGRGRVPVVLDVDGDDRPDLFTGQAAGVEYPSPNRVWVNRGDHFVLEEGEATAELGNWCADAADLDGDGLDELAVCTEARGLLLYRNEGGTFVEDTDGFGVKRRGQRAVDLADVDGDGRPDLTTVAAGHVRVRLNDGSRFGRAVVDLRVADGRDVAFGDADGDGDSDLYVQQGEETDEPDWIQLLEEGRAVGPPIEVPGTRGTAGDTVVAIPDWEGTGRAAFLVNNGHEEHAGRRQLFVTKSP
jgi:hypothetical protein